MGDYIQPNMPVVKEKNEDQYFYVIDAKFDEPITIKATVVNEYRTREGTSKSTMNYIQKMCTDSIVKQLFEKGYVNWVSKTDFSTNLFEPFKTHIDASINIISNETLLKYYEYKRFYEEMHEKITE